MHRALHHAQCTCVSAAVQVRMLVRAETMPGVVKQGCALTQLIQQPTLPLANQ